MTPGLWEVYAKARQIWLDAAALSRSESFITRTFGMTVLRVVTPRGWWS